MSSSVANLPSTDEDVYRTFLQLIATRDGCDWLRLGGARWLRNGGSAMMVAQLASATFL